MTKLFLWLNSILFIIASIVVYYILLNTNPTDTPYYVVWILLASFAIIVWSIIAYIGYLLRLFFAHNIFKDRDKSYILVRSERQGLLLGLLFSIQLALQGFLLFNVISATILTIAILLLEFFFIAQETKQ